MNKQITVSVIGLGYIGLPTACLLANIGHKVIGIDINSKVVETINTGCAHIVEPGLDSIIQNVIKSGNLRASCIPEPSDVFLISVPTPFKNGNSPDLSYVKSAVHSLAPLIATGNLIILESTSPVGTTKQISKWLSDLRPDLIFPFEDSIYSDIDIAYCPERVLPGAIFHELINNDRVIGGINQKSSHRARDFYKTFVDGECILTNSSTAEMCKLTENSFRDVNIAFANELSKICSILNIDVWELISLANKHPRVNILNPGPGVGGHCIAVDPWFIVDSCPQEAQIIKMARDINDSMPHFMASKIINIYKKFAISKIAVFGISYKPNVDDFRESPALKILEILINHFSIDNILLVEPYLTNTECLPQKLNNIKLVNIEDAFNQAELLVMLVDHDFFLQVPSHKFKGKYIIDSRGCWNNYIKNDL
jgi:UDP-N-acetyl-D-mannosaminuronic acid dehydrogenase